MSDQGESDRRDAERARKVNGILTEVMRSIEEEYAVEDFRRLGAQGVSICREGC